MGEVFNGMGGSQSIAPEPPCEDELVVLQRRLAEAEATIAALLDGQIDCVIDVGSKTPVLLANAQEALRASEDRYRRIVETTSEGVWLIDADHKTTFMNRRMAQILGCEADLGVGRTPFEFLDEQDRARLSRYMEGPGAHQIELQYIRLDGTKVWALLEATPVFDATGRYDGSLAMVRDISERKKSEAALLERMRIAALTTDVGMLITQEEKLHITLDRAAAALVKHLVVSFARIWTFDARAQVLELRASAGRPLELEGPHGRVPLGKLRVGRVAKARRRARSNQSAIDALPGDPVLDGIHAYAAHPMIVNDELVGVLGIFSAGSISDPAFAALGPISDALAVEILRKRVASTNAALEAQLRQSQKMEAVGRLAGGIAHDFNNILTVILSCSEVLMEELRDGDPARLEVEEISKAGTRAAALTRQLLMFSRQQVLEPKVLDLAALTRNLQNMLRRVVGEDVDLVLVHGPDLGRVRADPGSIEQVIANLVVNARDAMPTGGTLTIETRNEYGDEIAQTDRRVVLSVSDTGTGMTAATQARIFDPFFTTKEIGKGTGLGLSTVFGIVEQSNGQIAVCSEPGKGTRFTISLPHVEGNVDIAVGKTETTPRGTETIMLVEDEAQVRAVARALLQRHGYDVLEMRTGAEALAYCGAHPARIHLLVTDVVMPQMSGPELFRKLVVLRPDLRVLCVSGYADDSIVRHGVLQADLAYLQKPFTAETLTRKVREVLDAPRKT